MTSTVIAAMVPTPAQALFGPALGLVLDQVREVQVDQCIQFDGDGAPMRTSYATGRGQGLLATVTEVNGCGHVLPPADFVSLPTAVPAYTLLTLDTPHRHIPAKPSTIDLHAWLVARITDFLETARIKWLWTSTGPWAAYCDWKDDIYPSTPLGDAFAWQHSLRGVV
jgi:hypothetical protein